ncbi:hypothetical protein [Thioalkalivibrio sulfidiphilus]|uniref:hypothetical protein n=1 Tax=Thioalkalivibrio sulfidiphilus TaxID=1033854 RepID=UPI00035F623C|nr:hypothetical protein [Thioalkalivibrio sulfidiphilus]
MSDIQSKLAAGIREAKKQQDEPQAAKAETAKTPAPKAPVAKAPAKAAPARKPAAKPAVAQTEKATGDDPWGNLHPERVWPD